MDYSVCSRKLGICVARREQEGATSAAVVEHVVVGEGRRQRGEGGGDGGGGEEEGVDGHVGPALGGVQSADDVHHVGAGAGVVGHALQGDVRQACGAGQGEAGAELGVHEVAHLAQVQQRLHPCHRAH